MITIKFSAQPGAYERHLQRKYQNPLFPESERALLEYEVEQAREKDQQDLRAFFEAFEETVQATAGLSQSVETDELHELKQDLEQLYIQSASLAGDLSQYQQALSKLIQVCMNGLLKAAADDPTALSRLEQETMARDAFFDLIAIKMVADILRGDGIINEDELIPSLLSETEENLPLVMDLFEPDQQRHLFELATEFMQTPGKDEPQFETGKTRLAQMKQILVD